jgi:hypothetical protein
MVLGWMVQQTLRRNPMDTFTELAQEFANQIGLTVHVEYNGHRLHFDGDTRLRSTWIVTLKRNGASFTFDFGQSIDRSYDKNGQAIRVKPDLYDVLACLTKYDPGTFEMFCSNFGYDTDSRKAEKVYHDVCKEWRGVERLFGNTLDQLRGID